MVKFQHQLELQLVPEWRAAYINYKALKRELKVLRAAVTMDRTHRGRKGASPRSVELLLSGLQDEQLLQRLLDFTGPKVEVAGSESPRAKGMSEWEVLYKTEVPLNLEHRAEEASFFARLDSQLNKVNSFYTRKEAEYTSRFQELLSQLSTLEELTRDLESKQHERCLSPSTFEEDQFTLTAKTAQELLMRGPGLQASSSFSRSGSSSKMNSSRSEMEQSNCDSEEDLEPKAAKPPRVPGEEQGGGGRPFTGGARAAVQKLAEAVRRSSGGEDGDAERRKRREHAAKVLRKALVEFYRGLGLLRNYSSLNALGFGKILKKHDKVAGWPAGKAYMAAVDASHFQASNQVDKMMAAVEREFTRTLTHGSHRQAMVALRPQRRRSSHTVTFFLGLFAGCIVCLLLWLTLILSRTPRLPHPPTHATFTEAVFPAYRALALALLQVYMYGFDVMFWRRARVNYAFIFDFRPGTELHHRDVWLAASAGGVVLLGGMVAHLVLYQQHYGRVLAEGGSPVLGNHYVLDLMPAGIFVMLLGLLLAPFKFAFRSSRRFLTRTLWRIVSAPLYKVTLSDFFLADQLTSQVIMLWDLQYSACYFASGSFLTRNMALCTKTAAGQFSALAIGLLPFWFRLAQCIRRYFDEDHLQDHVLNGIKYVLGMSMVAARRLYLDHTDPGLRVLWMVLAVAATVYGCYWDLVMDWGLLQRNAKNPWLRDRLMLKTKWIYYLSMVVNVVLRLAWVQSIAQWKLGPVANPQITLFFAALEVCRRGHWNFYRLENEHLNNCGRYRAVKDIPLPFDSSKGTEV